MGTSPEPRWLSAEEQQTWLSLVGVMTLLSPALETQLQRDAGISHFEYQVLAMLSESPGRTALLVWPTGWSRELKIAGIESGPQISMHFELARELAHADELAYGVVLVAAELVPERRPEPSSQVMRAKTAAAVGVADEPSRTVGGPSRVDIDGWREALATASLSRALGSLLGMACGDALGTTNEFKKMSAPAFPELATGPVNDVVGGGPFRLLPGEITDDTQMACALAYPFVMANRFAVWGEVTALDAPA